MRTRIVRIGNSQGIRIPLPLLRQAGLAGEVELVVEGNTLRLVPASGPRAGWAEAFAEMTRQGEDAPVDGDLPALSSWDDEEWEWR